MKTFYYIDKQYRDTMQPDIYYSYERIPYHNKFFTSQEAALEYARNQRVYLEDDERFLIFSDTDDTTKVVNKYDSIFH